MNITVIGTGYVGLSLAVLLSQRNDVVAVDIVPEKVDKINRNISPISDKYIEEYMAQKKLRLRAACDDNEFLKTSDFVIIATPTNYDEDKNFFDTSSVDSVIQNVTKLNSEAVIVIKSTVPIGYTEAARKKYKNPNIIFSPEFLREGKALEDNLYPSRIIVGAPENDIRARKKADVFAELLREASLKKDIPVLILNPTEAEAVKLFSNTYLAMRVAYFNELDTYAEIMGLNTNEIIEGVCHDPRIGENYNNPSFGYGGYCLPKDTKQLRANFGNVPNKLVDAIVESNYIRKKHIAEMIISKRPKIVGIYRLTMKTNSDNFRQSAIQEIIKLLSQNAIDILIYEPSLACELFEGYHVVNDLGVFLKRSEIVLANRFTDELSDVKEKVYTRDLFGRD